MWRPYLHIAKYVIFLYEKENFIKFNVMYKEYMPGKEKSTTYNGEAKNIFTQREEESQRNRNRETERQRDRDTQTHREEREKERGRKKGFVTLP